jgi:hypothetical protein
MSGRPARCNFCLKELVKQKHVQLHIQNSPKCRAAFKEEAERRLSRAEMSQQTRPINPAEQLELNTQTSENWDDLSEEPDTLFIPAPRRARSPDELPSEAPDSKRTRVTVEEVEDEDAPRRYAEEYPERVADILGMGKTKFEEIREEQIQMGFENNPCAPFDDEEEWELARWLAKQVSQTATEEFLKLPIVSF